MDPQHRTAPASAPSPDSPPEGRPQLIIISGISGSGKSLALRVLEDAGYFCVDNLPLRNLSEVVLGLYTEQRLHVAVAVDVRTGCTFNGLRDVLERFRNAQWDARALFLNARTDILVRRYSESRRRHPLCAIPAVSGLRAPADARQEEDSLVLAQEANPLSTLSEAISHERELLAEMETLGLSIDTSELHPNTLRHWVHDWLGVSKSGRLTLLFESFGYKHGVPLDADFVFDVRCLPNPYYDPTLRPMTGLDQPVADWLCRAEGTDRMVADITRLLSAWIPAFERELRHYLTIAIGCTGGQHRSVYVSQALASHFGQDQRVLVRHRSLAAGHLTHQKTQAL